MGVDERARHRLNNRLEELLGVEEARTLMDYLPPGGWASLATKRDIEGLAVATKRDIEGLAADTRRDIEGLAAATKRDFEEMRTQIDYVATSLKKDIETSEHRVLATLRADLLSHTKTIYFAFTAAVISIGGVVIAAARLA